MAENQQSIIENGMTSHKRVAPPDDPNVAMLKAVAMDIGKDTVAYVEYMYPQAISATSSTFRLALRNHIFNQIIKAMKARSPEEIQAWLDARRKHRREHARMVKRSRETDHEAVRADPAKQEAELSDMDREWWRDENFPEERGE
jgi:hypothetical protein